MKAIRRAKWLCSSTRRRRTTTGSNSSRETPKSTYPSIDLRADAAQGKVIIADDVLTLENVRGKSAGGDLKLKSTMDFRTATTIMNFSIEAALLALNHLPRTWSIPALQGEVSGKADLQVTVRDGRSTTRGQGEGSVKMFPLLPPIKLRLSADDKGIHFNLVRN